MIILTDAEKVLINSTNDNKKFKNKPHKIYLK